MNRTLTTILLASCLVPGCTNALPSVPITNPAPITGGTLAITADGIAFAADTDRDVVWRVDLRANAVDKIALTDGDRPGRVALDGAGRAHVVLRGAGAVATIGADATPSVNRRAVCPEPRGIAYDAGADVVHVACAGGELVTLPAAGGAPVRTLRLDRDLRDVVVSGDTLLVSRFRAAELLAVSATGEVLSRSAPPPTVTPPGSEFTSPDNPGSTIASTPVVAWRTLALPGGEVGMVHQMATSVPVFTNEGAYGWGNTCSGPVVTTSVTFFAGNGSRTSMVPMPMLGMVLPVDMAADEAGNIAVVSAGTRQVSIVRRSELEASASPDGCGGGELGRQDDAVDVPATPIAIATWNGHWVVQTRDTAKLIAFNDSHDDEEIELGGRNIVNPGADVFHASWTGVACASCHPEGSDDGHTWVFDGLGARRTQNLTGGVMQRAPFHWRGELRDFSAVIDEVLVKRMEGSAVGPAVPSLARWLDGLPAPRPSPTGTPAQIAHGKQLFEDPLVGCTGCHAGKDFTSHQRQDVGTGNSFQVPSLVGVAARAPYFHDGCAATLEERFDANKAACNGGDLHGHTSQLGVEDIGDLVRYLETL